MTSWFDTRAADAAPDEFSTDVARRTGPASLQDVFFAELDRQSVEDLTTAQYNAMQDARAERRKVIEDATGRSYDELVRERGGGAYLTDAANDRIVEAIAQELPVDKRGQVHTGDRLERRADELALEKLYAARETLDSRGDLLAGATALAGSFVGSFRDPVVLATIPLGAPQWAGILRFALTEAAINAGTEAAVQPLKQDYRARLGLETGLGVAAQEIAAAGAFGAAFGAGAKGIEIGGRALVRRFRREVPDPTPEQRAAADAVEREADIADTSPFTPTREGADENARREIAAAESIATGRPAAEPEPPADVAQTFDAVAANPAAHPRMSWPQEVATSAPDGGIVSGRAYRFDPETIGADAPRFQFKGGVDSAGVTDKFAGVTKWDADAAGQVMVWEDADGNFWIVDGHHRLELARRLKAAGQDVEIEAKVWREADGWTDTDMRTRAAIINIRQETGTEIDAAKVFRDKPEIAESLGLDPRRQFARTAQGLARLSDDAFTMVVNELVPPRFAGLVGEMAPADKGLHAQMLDALKRANPASVEEARFMVADMLAAPRATETTADLFGSMESEQILLKERAALRAGVVSSLRKDRAVFGRLVDEETRITEAGNTLDAGANRARRDADAEALAMVERLSNRKGEIADALNAAAKELRDGGNKVALVRRLVDDVKRAIADEHRGGGPVRGGTGDAAGAAPGRPQAGDRADAAGGQPEPVKRDGDQLVIPGAEKASDATMAQRGADAALKPAADQKPADEGLFGSSADQADLVDRLRAAPADPAGSARYADPADAQIEAEAAALRAGADDLFGKGNGLDEIEIDFDDGGRATARETLDEIDADKNFADQLGLCLKGKGNGA